MQLCKTPSHENPAARAPTNIMVVHAQGLWNGLSWPSRPGACSS
jgi:hypothetical protein